MGYVLGISVVSGLLFGIAPALWAARSTPSEVLKEGSRTGTGGTRSRRWSEVLVVGEVAVALLLTLSAGLLVRSFLRVQQVDPGFVSEGVIAATLGVPDTRYDSNEKVQAFFDALVARARGLPGVTEAAVTSGLPLTDNGYTSDFVIAGRPAGEYGSEVRHRTVTADYFKVMRVPLLQGRVFNDSDQSDGTQVVLINDAFARAHFRNQNPLGQRITFDRVPDSTSVWRTIVGIVGSERQRGIIQEPSIEAYHPMSQDQQSYMSLVVRTQGDPAGLGPAIRNIVLEQDPTLAIASMQTMKRVRSDAMARDRFLTALMMMFAGVGLLLSIIGVYGVMAQLAQGRTREMGIRLALGARVSQVRWLVVGRGVRLIAVGLVVGLVGAALTTRGLRALLYQIAPGDPPTFVAAPILIALAGLAACWIPAAMAGRMDPARALRIE
jgi:putative ABC transport system permease protein